MLCVRLALAAGDAREPGDGPDYARGRHKSASAMTIFSPHAHSKIYSTLKSAPPFAGAMRVGHAAPPQLAQRGRDAAIRLPWP
jgi:hypothetical protein